jgi:hypothetical protein
MLIALKTLILDNINANNFLDNFIHLPNLSSLTINHMHIDNKFKRSIYFYPICCLHALKYCKIPGISIASSIPTGLNSASPIKHLVIHSIAGLEALRNLLLYVPHLRRLSIDHLEGSHRQSTETFPTTFNKLTHVSLKLEHIECDEFQLFMTNLFHNLQVLRISTSDDIQYLFAHQWEQLIASHMVHLRIFDLQYSYSTVNINHHDNYHTLFRQFTSSFWIERKWYFAHQYHRVGNLNCGMFYSTQPYRYRKGDFIFAGEGTIFYIANMIKIFIQLIVHTILI